MVLFLDNNVAAGALVKASARAPIFLATTECLRALLVRPSISRSIESAPLKANPADAARRREASASEPQVRGESAPLQHVLQLGQVFGGAGMSIGSVSIG